MKTNYRTMKRSFVFTAILTIILVSCQKFDNPIDDSIVKDTEAIVNDMSALNISENFDWSLTKTIDLNVTLPAHDASRILYVYSGDEERLYFKGHTDDGSSVLKSKITIPTYETTVFIKYGIGNDYPKMSKALNGVSLNYSISNNLKSTITTDCDNDGNNNISTFGGFRFEFDGMVENMDGTSTWTYTVTGVAPSGPTYKDLSHWVLALCENHSVIAVTPNSAWEVNTDPTLEIYGIKWDHGINKEGGTKTFSITLNKQYDIGLIDVAFKAGQNKFYCSINGPSCEEGDPDPDPEFEGTLAFEDLWPGKGDYDINDLVVEYNFDIDKDNSEKIKDITATFEVRAFGAALHNGFGFSFPNVDPSDILSVTGYDIQGGSIFSLASNGVEIGQSDATFIVFDDAFNIMQHPGSGIGVNTDHPAPYVQPVTITLYIDFADGQVSYSQLDIGNFNPFIVISQSRGMEVHLPDYPPTDLHNPSIFGTYEDDSNPGAGRYYKTHNNLFWAINIPERFDYPNEKQVITGAYLKFANWAQSDGVLFPDWYKDLPGYRNASAIY